MSRASHAKSLDEELRRLFHQNVSEADAYEQLKGDNRFENVRPSKISALYKQLRSQQGKKPKRKKPSIIQRSDQLAHFKSALEECDHTKMRCLKVWNSWTSDGRFFVVAGRVNENAIDSTLKDIFSNKTCRIVIPIIQAMIQYRLWPLTRDIGLLTECMDYDHQDTAARISLSLMQFDWLEKKIQKVATFSFEDQQRRFKLQSTIVDEMDPTRFLLRNQHGDRSVTLKFGRVENSNLLFGDEILAENRHIGLGFRSLIGNTLYSFDPLRFIMFKQPRIYVTQFGHGEQTSIFDLSLLPEQFTTVLGKDVIVGCFAMDRLYLAVQHKETTHYGIVWTSHQTRTWETINFDIKQQITEIDFIIDGHILLIQAVDHETELTSNVHQVQSSFYRIPLKKPEKLSILAWSCLVRSKRKLGMVDPYEEARNYLPHNSSIRCPFED